MRLAVLAITLLLSMPLVACDSSCDDLQAKICKNKSQKSDCKFIRNTTRRDRLSSATCASILKSLRTN